MFIERISKCNYLSQKNNYKTNISNQSIQVLPPWKNYNYEDIKGEIWKEIPSFDDYFLISNFGRAKSVDRIIYTSNNKQRFFKGIILKQTVIKTRNKTVGDFNIDCKVGFSYLGKSHTLRMATLVYRLFVGDIEANLIISHIDGNNLNNASNNLKLITLQQKQKKIYDTDRGVKIFEFQTTVTQKKAVIARHKPITQFCLQGNPIRSFNSIKEATLETSIDNSSIVAAIKQIKMVSAGGFLWQYGIIAHKIDTSYYTNFLNKSRQVRGIPVVQINGAFEQVATYDSIKQAYEKTNISYNEISQCLKNKKTMAGGYYWQTVEIIN